MISESGYVCIVAVKDSFSWNINQHPVNAWKYYRVDTCDWNEGYRNEFINFPLTNSTELVNRFQIMDYKSVAIFCREKFFEKKGINNSKGEYDFALGIKGIGRLQVFLTQMEFGLAKIIKDEIHIKDENKLKAKWVEDVVLRRNEYYHSTSKRFKKFTILFKNKNLLLKWLIPRSFLVGLIFFPLAIRIADAFGVDNSSVVPIWIYSILYFYAFLIQEWGGDGNYRREILANEKLIKSIIREKLQYSSFP